MCGVWVALEDIDSDNGPLVYYPGSHKLPVFTNEHVGANPDWSQSNPYVQYPKYEQAWERIVRSLGLKPLHFHAKKGQALIWSANLLHGGAAQKNLKRTRYSQVTHYYFQGCCYYTPLGSVPFLGPIQFREIVDISTGRTVPNIVNGRLVRDSHLEYSRPSAHTKALQPSEELPKPKHLPKNFDRKGYLDHNPDVAAAKVDPAKHWLEFGYRENRRWR
jgi:hypothetical protein